MASRGSASSALRLRAEVRPFIDTWTERFAANNLLTYSSAIALQPLVALAALLFLAVALLNPLNVAAFAGGGAFEPHIPAIDVAERVIVPALMIYAIVALLVYVAPAKRVPWRWASAGSILIVVAWFLVSAVYADWLANVVNLRTPEGTLALVLSTVGYLYASAIAFLVGAQLDQLLREGGVRAALGGRR